MVKKNAPKAKGGTTIPGPYPGINSHYLYKLLCFSNNKNNLFFKLDSSQISVPDVVSCRFNGFWQQRCRWGLLKWEELGSEVNQMCWVGHMVERLMKRTPVE